MSAQTPLRPRGTGKDQSDFVAPLAELEKRVSDFYTSKGAKLANRYPLVHNLPDLEKYVSTAHGSHTWPLRSS